MRTSHATATAFALTLLAAALPSQTAPCFSTNDATNASTNVIYSYSAAAPNSNGWQITPAAPLVVQSRTVYTGNTYTSQVGNFMTLEIWDENPANTLPGTRIAGGTWRINPAKDWQGTNLDMPAVLQANTNYWIVFTEPGWSTPPFQPSGTTMPGARLSGGSWVGAGATALKCRLYCGLLDQQNVASFGAVCTSSTGTFGTLFTNQAPTLGNADFRIEGTGFASGALVFLVLGMVPQYPSIPVPGTANCFQSTDALITLVDFTGTGNVRAPLAFGHATFPIPLPSGAGYLGLYFAPQLAALDPGSLTPIPFVTSNALQVTVF